MGMQFCRGAEPVRLRQDRAFSPGAELGGGILPNPLKMSGRKSLLLQPNELRNPSAHFEREQPDSAAEPVSAGGAHSRRNSGIPAPVSGDTFTTTVPKQAGDAAGLPAGASGQPIMPRAPQPVTIDMDTHARRRRFGPGA